MLKTSYFYYWTDQIYNTLTHFLHLRIFLQSVMGTLSRTCNIPSPSQRPRVPPRDARNLEKLNVGKSLIVMSTLLSKAMSILDIFLLLEVLYTSSIKTVLAWVWMHGRGQPGIQTKCGWIVNYGWNIIIETWILIPSHNFLILLIEFRIICHQMGCDLCEVVSCPDWNKATEIILL